MTDTTYPPYNPTIHHRRSIRLRGYDYSKAGAYFITICTHSRECLFGAVGAGSKPALVRTKPALMVGLQGRAGLEPAPLPEIVRQMKTFSARRINKNLGTPGRSVWQRNYYEHIIRDEDDLNRIRGYIANNPANWQSDENYRLIPNNPVAEEYSITPSDTKFDMGDKQ